MKNQKYTQLNQSERDRIEALLASGHKQKEIAEILKRDKGTISREISRNRRRKRARGGTVEGKYEATVAQQKAYVKRKYSKYQGKKIEESKGLKEYIVTRLEEGWSPDEISGRMKKEKTFFYANKNTIYEWLYSSYGQIYCHNLYSKRYRSKKRRTKKTKRTLIPNRIGIEKRPKGATSRTRYGHYEGDIIVSAKKTASKVSLAVVFERKAKYAQLKKIQRPKPDLFNKAINQINKKLSRMNSLTLDNGIENTKHEELKIPTYFCDPYSSWQKGGVENINKMIRRYIPKGSDINDYSDKDIERIENIINNKPRKSLNYKTSLEIMVEHNLLTKKQLQKVALGGGI